MKWKSVSSQRFERNSWGFHRYLKNKEIKILSSPENLPAVSALWTQGGTRVHGCKVRQPEKGREDLNGRWRPPEIGEEPVWRPHFLWPAPLRYLNVTHAVKLEERHGASCVSCIYCVWTTDLTQHHRASLFLLTFCQMTRSPPASTSEPTSRQQTETSDASPPL